MTVTQKQRKYRNAVVRVLQFYAQENAKPRNILEELARMNARRLDSVTFNPTELK